MASCFPSFISSSRNWNLLHFEKDQRNCWIKLYILVLRVCTFKNFFIPIQDGSFWGCSEIGGGEQKGCPSLKSVTHRKIIKFGTGVPYLPYQNINHMTHPSKFAGISIFSPGISNFCYIKKYRYRLHFISDSNSNFWVFNGCFNNYGCNFDDINRIGYSKPS